MARYGGAEPAILDDQLEDANNFSEDEEALYDSDIWQFLLLFQAYVRFRRSHCLRSNCAFISFNNSFLLPNTNTIKGV